MEKTPQEMAEHIRAAVANLNAVLKEAQAEYFKTDLYINGLDGCTGSIGVKSIQIVKTL